jgi:hypothetical protein
MSAVVVIVLWGVFIQGEDMTVRQITPECGETTCTITVEEAKAIAQLQAIAAHAYTKAKRSCFGRET